MSEKETDAVLDQIADADAELVDVVDEALVSYQDLYIALLKNPEQRDPDIWAATYEDMQLDDLGVDVEEFLVTEYGALNEVPINERELVVNRIELTMRVSAHKQAMMHTIRRTIEIAKKNHDRLVMKTAGMSRSTLTQMAKVGPGKARYDAATARRKDARGNTTVT